MEPQRLPPDLLDRVHSGIQREGYCIFDASEMERLLAHAGRGQAARQRVIEEFARACGAAVETTPHFTSARFVKAQQTCQRED